MKTLLPQDIRRLEQATSRKFFWFVNLLMPFMIFFFVGMGFINLALADRFARIDGESVGIVWKSWIAGIDVQRSYSGVSVKATEKLTNGVLMFTAAFIFMTPMWIASNLLIRRSKRFLDFVNTTRGEPVNEADEHRVVGRE